MRTPFKNEEALCDRYSKLSELAKLEYHRRLDEARCVGFAAYATKQATTTAEATLAAKKQGGKRSELLTLGIACVLGFIGFALNFDVAKNFGLAFLVAWFLISFLRNEVVIPNLERQIIGNQLDFQVLSSRWSCVVGSIYFSDYLKVLESEYVGCEVESSEEVYLHIRGSILVKVDNLRYQP